MMERYRFAACVSATDETPRQYMVNDFEAPLLQERMSIRLEGWPDIFLARRIEWDERLPDRKIVFLSAPGLGTTEPAKRKTLEAHLADRGWEKVPTQQISSWPGKPGRRTFET